MLLKVLIPAKNNVELTIRGRDGGLLSLLGVMGYLMSL